MLAALVAMLALPAAVTTAQEVAMPENLVANPGLSEGVYGPARWALNRGGDNEVEWYVSADESEFALRLGGSGQDWAGATSQTVAVTPDETLTVAAWIRSDAAGGDRDRLFVRFFGERAS